METLILIQLTTCLFSFCFGNTARAEGQPEVSNLSWSTLDYQPTLSWQSIPGWRKQVIYKVETCYHPCGDSNSWVYRQCDFSTSSNGETVGCNLSLPLTFHGNARVQAFVQPPRFTGFCNCSSCNCSGYEMTNSYDLRMNTDFTPPTVHWQSHTKTSLKFSVALKKDVLCELRSATVYLFAVAAVEDDVPCFHYIMNYESIQENASAKSESEFVRSEHCSAGHGLKFMSLDDLSPDTKYCVYFWFSSVFDQVSRIGYVEARTDKAFFHVGYVILIIMTVIFAMAAMVMIFMACKQWRKWKDADRNIPPHLVELADRLHDASTMDSHNCIRREELNPLEIPEPHVLALPEPQQHRTPAPQAHHEPNSSVGHAEQVQRVSQIPPYVDARNFTTASADSTTNDRQAQQSNSIPCYVAAKISSSTAKDKDPPQLPKPIEIFDYSKQVIPPALPSDKNKFGICASTTFKERDENKSKDSSCGSQQQCEAELLLPCCDEDTSSCPSNGCGQIKPGKISLESAVSFFGTDRDGGGCIVTSGDYKKFSEFLLSDGCSFDEDLVK